MEAVVDLFLEEVRPAILPYEHGVKVVWYPRPDGDGFGVAGWHGSGSLCVAVTALGDSAALVPVVFGAWN